MLRMLGNTQKMRRSELVVVARRIENTRHLLSVSHGASRFRPDKELTLPTGRNADEENEFIDRAVVFKVNLLFKQVQASSSAAFSFQLSAFSAFKQEKGRQGMARKSDKSKRTEIYSFFSMCFVLNLSQWSGQKNTERAETD